MMRLFSALILFAFCIPLQAEESKPLKRLTVLRFDMGKTGLASGLFAEAEAGLRLALVERGGFDVRDAALSLSPEESAFLFEKFKTAKVTPVPIPETVSIGEKTVSGEVIQSLLESAVVVVPAVVEYRTVEDKRSGATVNYKVTLESELDFMLLEGDAAFVTRRVETMGYDPDKNRALADAIKTILPMFSYELSAVQGIRPDTVILAYERGEAIIDRGGKQGALLGAEFTIRGVTPGENGKPSERDKGLLIVSETTDDVSVGTIEYADPDVAAGDAVEEVKRFGLDITPYALTVIPYDFSPDIKVYAGLRVTLAKGVYTLRPFASVEFAVYPFSTYLDWFPVRPFLGCELRFRFGRFELAALPMIGIEEWFALSPSQTSTFMGFGLRGIVQAGLLVSRDVRLFLEGGYEYWFGNRQGFLADLGISIKL